MLTPPVPVFYTVEVDTFDRPTDIYSYRIKKTVTLVVGI